MKFLKEIIPYIIIIIVVMIIRTFLISPAKVNGHSMKNTLFDKEVVFVNKIVHYTNNYNRFDIVVVKIEDEYLIKRIIGFEGETVEYRDNELYINDEKAKIPVNFEYTADFKAEVDKDSVFVLGDNRDVSKDSRFYGSFKISDLRGTVTIRIFPFTKIGNVK